MPVSRLKFDSLPHAIFLQRVTAQSPATSLEARLGQGAFLALRLVDLLAADREPVASDAFHYQWIATDRFCRELRAAATEGAHVHGIAASAADAHRLNDRRMIAPTLLAYGHYLEDALRLDEALDVLWTLVQVGGVQLSSPDAVAVRLRLARVNRKLNRFDEAEVAYTEAGELATVAGDRYSELLSRIGRAYATTGRGNLAEAERILGGVLADAEAGAGADRDAAALAHQALAVVLSTGGRPVEAIPHEWRAFQLYEDGSSRMRVLSDLAVMLLTVGEVDGAERALNEIVRHGATRDVLDNALIELMHCASYRRDRVGFERWREQCDARRESMPPNMLVEFMLKAGIGRARFGQLDRAERLLASALRIADEAGLHEFTFRIERIKAGLRDSCQSPNERPAEAADPVVQSEAVREVSAGLAHLAGAT